jgi:CRISPR-associated protein Cas5h
MPKTLISFDLQAGFGVFKKPDVNEGMQLTFNMLHKPALLGILGSIAGLKGYEKKGEFPEYYRLLQSLQIGIEPLEGWHERGNFTKTVIKYTNTVGYANAGMNLLVTEQTLHKPAYRCYLLLDTDLPLQALLHERILAGEAEYLPYFGKNECSAWWETLGENGVKSYNFMEFQKNVDFQINSLFISQYSLRSQKIKPKLSPTTRSVMNASTFGYFERLPTHFREDKKMEFIQYELADFAYSDWYFTKESTINDLYQINCEGIKKIIQVF